MNNYEITLAKIRNKNNLEESTFLGLYNKLILGDKTLSDNEKFFLLKIAVYFLNSKDQNVERLGYRIILRYANLFNDYTPLYDIALSRDYIPITKFIERKHFDLNNTKETFSNLYIQSYQESFKIEGDINNIYRSLGQMILNGFSETEDNIAIIAPTSYGKSEMIIKKVENSLNKKVCIVVPSKALLAQTRKSLLKNELIKTNFKKIITHPDMFKEGATSFLAVLTQERLLRLLQKYKELAIDLVLIDEAHNLLEDNERSHLLAQVLLILQNRKNDFVANFFTPFVVNISSLAIRNTINQIKSRPIEEYMKIERFYAYDFDDNKFYLYDQFLNKEFKIEIIEQFTNDIGFILSQKSSKNIIYLNRPITVEQFSLSIAKERDEIQLTPEIEKIIKSISDFIHPEYNLIKCINNGVLYHHGGIPDIIRLYVEEIFSKYKEFEFIVTTSTLLEGVNIPAEKIFILTPAKGHGYLSAAQFKNLIGRVCRFKEVFDNESGNLSMLEPEIYLIKGKYAPKNFSLLNFYKTKVNSSIIIEDVVENPLLENSENTENLNNILEYLENMEAGSSGLHDVASPDSEIGKLCYSNNIHDFDILSSEATLVNNLDYYKQVGLGLINNAESLINSIVQIFFEGVTLIDKSDNIKRIKENSEARGFYSMFIGWRSQAAPYPLMIHRFLSYWKKRESRGDTLIYIGSKWGELVRDGHQRLFVDISKKNEEQRVNLAIAKIKEEQEFIDFNILKYLEILNELELVDHSFYDQVKYGTSNEEIICMLKNGFSMELSKLLTTDYNDKLEFILEQDYIQYDQTLIDLMKQNEENEILIFEAESSL